MSLKICPQPCTARLRSSIDLLVSWVLAIAFFISAIPHLGNPYYFLGSVYAYGLIGPHLGEAAAMVLPVMEILVAICLMGAIYTDGAHCVGFAMLTSFAVVQTIAWMRGLQIDCGCFGPRYETVIGLSSLTRIYGLLIASGLRNTIRFCEFF